MFLYVHILEIERLRDRLTDLAGRVVVSLAQVDRATESVRSALLASVPAVNRAFSGQDATLTLQVRKQG